MARDMHLELDEDGYRRAMQEQREKARAAWAGSGEEKVKPIYKEVVSQASRSRFSPAMTSSKGPRRSWRSSRATRRVTEAHDGDEVEIILDQTPFYAESGGQVGDKGELLGEASKFEVKDTMKPVAGPDRP